MSESEEPNPYKPFHEEIKRPREVELRIQRRSEWLKDRIALVLTGCATFVVIFAMLLLWITIYKNLP
ncbi:MAG: hypothetical protein AAFV88_21460 [Planctomycetota bacterium]